LKYRSVATGGTFDHLHKGHHALLARSFALGDVVVIGVTSDAFASRQGKTPDQSYEERVEALERWLNSNFPGRGHVIAKLDDFFGPGIASREVEAIVVTQETAARVPLANSLRAERGYPPLEVDILDHVLADDGRPISSTRIRRGEIDPEGKAVARRKGGPTADARKG